MRYNIDIQFFGRGRSKGGGGGGGVPSPTPNNSPFQDYPEAFQAGKDFEAVNGVNHVTRTVSRTTQREWEQYANTMYQNVGVSDEDAIMRQFDPTPNAHGDNVSGYVRTRNSFAINEALYDPKNAGKSDSQIFKRPEDVRTLQALDRAIGNHVTPADASYTRFCSEGAIAGAFGFDSNQMAMLKNAGNMTPSQLQQLSNTLSGTISFSNSYTSTSANRSLNAFKNPNNSQSRGFIFERKINVPQGTHAYAPRGNAQESEVIFGRKMSTQFMGLSIASDGHIVIHEMYAGNQ